MRVVSAKEGRVRAARAGAGRLRRAAPGRYHARSPAFTRWEEPDTHGKALERLQRDLGVETSTASAG